MKRIMNVVMEQYKILYTIEQMMKRHLNNLTGYALKTYSRN
jgi:hypothetical protein